MIEDFGADGEGAEFKCDICIVGAGAAGVTLARELLSSGRQVLLLESGGEKYETAVQDMAAGHNIGFPYYDIDHSRLRLFGGTTAIWGGRTAELDAIDFKRRAWIAHSGWPLHKGDLEPYYRRAHTLLDLPTFSEAAVQGFEKRFDEVVLQRSLLLFDEKFDRFALNNCNDLKTAPDLTVLLHATVTGFKTNESGSVVKRALIANLKGGRGVVTAQQFVLATGGLEVPRVLLASKSPAHPNGIGNAHDLLGRFFMEHPRARGAQIVAHDASKLLEMMPAARSYRGRRYSILLRPSEQLQAREGLLNTGFTINVRKHAGERQELGKQIFNALRHEISPNDLGRGLWKTSRRISDYLNNKLGKKIKSRKLAKEGFGLYAVLRAEQAPNPSSRVTLSEEKDALGLPRLNLDWQFSDIDRESAAGAMRALDHELKRLKFGYVEPAAWLEDKNTSWEIDPLISKHPIGGYHHMGTARMAESDKDGVVDADGRVHGVENLFIAGSAVFPTVGWANPTLTILALCLRLADKLKTAD